MDDQSSGSFPFEALSWKVSNLKCFGGEPQGFPRILPINIVIGRNNSGKSTLLEMICHPIPSEFQTENWHKGEQAKVFLSMQLTERVIEYFRDQYPAKLRDVVGDIHKIKDRFIEFFVDTGSGQTKIVPIPEPPNIQTSRQVADRICQIVADAAVDRLSKITMLRIAADRDIRPEEDIEPFRDLEVGAWAPSGDGITKIIQRIMHNNKLDHKRAVEQHVLDDLNAIFQPDEEFLRIDALRIKPGNLPSNSDLQKARQTWEIYLESRNRLNFPLSNMGSGLKTIIMILMTLRIAPMAAANPLSNYFFCFEELENNLHPDIQRRLFKFLRTFAIEHGCHFFITTHSHVVIDLFARDSNAQILHVKKTDDVSEVVDVAGHSAHGGIFDDLAVRASDLLQSNVVVWMEGPSDRIYFNRWVELWTDGRLKEGADYQCVFTGGSILANYSFGEEDEDGRFEDFIQALKVNRNAIVMMDRDRDSEAATLKPNVARVNAELINVGMSWVTAGREVENYIPESVMRSIFNKLIVTANLTDPFAKVYDMLKAHTGKDWTKRKTELATKACALWTIDLIIAAPELADKVRHACEFIDRCNGRSST